MTEFHQIAYPHGGRKGGQGQDTLITSREALYQITAISATLPAQSEPSRHINPTFLWHVKHLFRFFCTGRAGFSAAAPVTAAAAPAAPTAPTAPISAFATLSPIAGPLVAPLLAKAPEFPAAPGKLSCGDGGTGGGCTADEVTLTPDDVLLGVATPFGEGVEEIVVPKIGVVAAAACTGIAVGATVVVGVDGAGGAAMAAVFSAALLGEGEGLLWFVGDGDSWSTSIAFPIDGKFVELLPVNTRGEYGGASEVDMGRVSKAPWVDGGDLTVQQSEYADDV